MSKPYKCMYVLPEERYKSLLQGPSQSTPAHSQSSRCPQCGREFKNSNILAHHMKSHVNGFKCNICGKVFKHKRSLRKHLAGHGPQAPRAGPPPPKAAAPPPRAAAPPPRAAAPNLQCPICNKRSKHKHNLSRHIRRHASNLKFQASKWETLKRTMYTTMLRTEE